MIALRRLRLPMAAWLALVAVAVWGWARIPDDARVPVHWNIRGEADGYASKPFALLGIVAIGGFTTLLIAILPLIDPRGRNVRRSVTPMVATATMTNLVLLVTEVFVILGATGDAGDPARVIFPALGIMFMVIGNYMPKTGSNFFVGIRTPWTLSSERSWRKTHELGGRLSFALGALVLVVGIVWPSVAGFVLVGGALGMAGVTTLYSYRVWKDELLAEG